MPGCTPCSRFRRSTRTAYSARSLRATALPSMILPSRFPSDQYR